MRTEQELVFPVEEYRRRVDRALQAMARDRLDLLLVHSLPGICYLSGFQTLATGAYACLVLAPDGRCALVVERDEQHNAHQSAWVEDVATYARSVDPVEVTLATVRRLATSPQRIGIETATRYLPPARYLQLRDGMAPAALADASAIVPWSMLLKSAAEVAVIRRAAAITARGMRAAVDAVAVGRTDNEVAALASQALIAGGSEYMSSDPIVCVGRNAAVPHGHYANRRIAPGDSVLLEMSACVGRYSAPIMRAATLGPPDPDVARMADSCRRGLEAVIAEMRPGNAFAAAAARAKPAIAAAGEAMIFHGTYAYSIGLGFPGTSWADCPLEVRDGAPTLFEPGMVFHLPISLRDAGKAGVAFSETVVITRDGCEVLTDMPRELFVK